MNRRIGVVLSYILMVFEVLSTLLLTPFIIRTLGQAEYGVYKLAVSVNAYLFLLDLGVGNAVTRYIAKYRANNEKEQERKFFGVALIYYGVIALLAIFAGAALIMVFPGAFSKGLTSEEIALGQKLLGITMLNSAITLGATAFSNTIVAYERFYISKGASIIQIIIRIILTWLALLGGMGSVGIVAVNCLLTFLCRGFFIYYVLFNIKLKPMFRGIQATFIKDIVLYSSWILVQMIATQLNSSVDQVLIGALVPASSVILAVYSVGTQISQYFQSIGSAFTGVLMPGLVKLVEGGASSSEITKEMVRVGRIILMVLMLIWSVFIINGQEFVVLWAGSANQEAYVVALMLMTAYMLILTEAVGTQILWAKNEHKEQAILKFTIIIMNIMLTVLLIKWKPMLGATLGTFISLILGDICVMNYVFKKKIGIQLLSYYKGLMHGIVPCACASIFVGGALRYFLVPGLLRFLLVSFVMCAVYCLLLTKFGMSDYEKNLVGGFFKKLKLKRTH